MLISFLLYVYSEVRGRTARLYNSSTFSFWGNFILFSIKTVLIYIAIHNVEILSFSASFPAFVIFCLFGCNHSKWGEMISHLWLSFAFCLWLVMLNIFFIHLLAFCISSFEKYLFRLFVHFKCYLLGFSTKICLFF
jgi:hypothetical protein